MRPGSKQLQVRIDENSRDNERGDQAKEGIASTKRNVVLCHSGHVFELLASPCGVRWPPCLCFHFVRHTNTD